VRLQCAQGHEQWSKGAGKDVKSMKFQTKTTEIQIMPQLLLCGLAYSVLPKNIKKTILFQKTCI
jgi:hypothetical protein